MLLLPLLLGCSGEPHGVMLVVTDNVRGDLGGAELPSWIEQGRWYTEAHSAASCTTPSAGTLLTGAWPQQAGITACPGRDIAHESLRLPSVLHDAAGRGEPQALVAGWPILKMDRLGWAPEGAEIEVLDSVPTAAGEMSREVLEQTRAWVADQDEPWMLVVWTRGAHAPWRGAPPETSEHLHKLYQGLVTGPPPHADQAPAAYRLAVEDTLPVVASLVELAGPESTVLWTSDHGEALGEDGLWYHGTGLHRPQTHVPLWVSGPQVEPGVDDTPVGATAVAATLRAAAQGLSGCDLRQGTQGCDAPRSGMVIDGQWQEVQP